MTASVSVVIPSFHSEGTIKRAIDSVLAQTLSVLEIIVVVDGGAIDSLEATGQVLEPYGESVRSIWLLRNGGAASARNVGWEQARGQFVAFLDADDSWHPEKVFTQVQAMEANPHLVLTGHAIASKEDGPRRSDALGKLQIKEIKVSEMLLHNPFPTPTVMIKRQLNLRFKDGKRYVDDHLLWMEVVLSGHQAGLLNLKLATVYKPMFGASGLSGHLWKMEKGELDAYAVLWRRGLLSPVLAGMLWCLSMIKFLRRLVVVGIKGVT